MTDLARWMGRVFASAIIRKVAFLLVAAALGYASIGRAQAVTISEAGAQCWAQRGSFFSGKGWWGSEGTQEYECRLHPDYPATKQIEGWGRYKPNATGVWSAWYRAGSWVFTEDCGPGTEWDVATRTCKVGCAGQETSHLYDGAEANSTFCSGGCEFKQAALGGAPPTGQSCTTPYPCGAGQVPGTGFYTGMCRNDLDNDGSPDNDDFAPTDPTNGRDGSEPPPPPLDTDGDGDPDPPPGDESDNVSSGGGSCDAPPVSSGDAIAAQVAFQAWGTKCAVRAQAELQQATVDKLEAIRALEAAQATASKQDDIKAEIGLSRAQIAQFQAAQVAEAITTNIRLSESAQQQATEVAATQAKIDAFKDQEKAEQDETQQKVADFMAQQADEVADTLAKLDELKGLSMEELIKSDRRDTSINTVAGNQLLIADAQAARDAVRDASDAERNGMLQALNDKLAAQTAADATQSADEVGMLQWLGDKLDGILGKLTGDNGEGLKVNGGTASDMTETNGLLGTLGAKIDAIGAQIHDALEPGDPDTTGEDATASSVMRTDDMTAAFDDAGMGWSRACPAPVVVSILGQTITLGTSILCNWLQVGGWFVLLLTGFRCLKIVGEA